MEVERPRRINGLSKPYTPAQMSTWVFLPALVLQFVIVCSPLMPVAASIPVTLVVCALAVSSVYFGYLAMTIDPADPRILIEEGHQNHDHHPHDNEEDGATKQCWICDKQVGEKSMHCKYCNKCVDHFDHHCMWLNTCVGKANYNHFFRTMVSITSFLLGHGMIQIALIIDIFVRSDEGTSLKSEDWFNTDARIGLVIVMAIFLLFDIGAFSLMGQLLAFHVKLQKQGLTTYAFIVQDNQRRREQTKIENELRTLRSVEISKAQQEGRTCFRMQLQITGMLRKSCGMTMFDPIDPNRTSRAAAKKNRNATSRSSSDPDGNPNALREVVQTGTDDIESFEAVRKSPTNHLSVR